MQHTAKRILTRAGVVGIAATTAIAGLSTPASAHATVKTDNTVAGTYTVLTFSIGHGCEGEPTIEAAIQIPEPILSVSPTVNDGWEIEMVNTTLDEPVTDRYGNEVTERISEVVYTADTPLPDDYRDAFELSLRLPEETAGQTLYFPVVQTCTEGEHAWIQIAEDDDEELDEPAPFIEVTTADAAVEAGDDAEAAPEAAASADEGDSSSNTLTYVALVVGAVGVLLGGFGLFRGRRTS